MSPAISISLPGYPASNEISHTRAVARSLGQDVLHWEAPDYIDEITPRALDASTFSEEAPHTHPGAAYEILFEQWAWRETGGRVRMSGFGGDQIMMAPDYWVWRQLMLGAPSRGKIARLRWEGRRKPNGVARHALAVFAPEHVHGILAKPRRVVDVLPSLAAFVPDELVAPESVQDGLRRRSDVSRIPGASPLSIELGSLRWEKNMRELRFHRDAIGRDSIYPFLDEELWEWMLGCPPWLLVGPKKLGRAERIHDKLLMRRAHHLLGMLPPEVAWRGKLATMESFVHALMIGPWVQTLREYVHDMRLEEMGILKQGVAARTLDLLTTLDSIPKIQSFSPVAGLWNFLVIEAWVRAMEE